MSSLMQGYLDQRRAWKTANATAAEAFITEQLKSVRVSLGEIETRLANYRTNNRAVVLDNEAKALIEQVGPNAPLGATCSRAATRCSS